MMKKVLKMIAMLCMIVVISFFPVFMAPTRSVWDTDKEDHKKIAEQIKGEEKANPD